MGFFKSAAKTFLPIGWLHGEYEDVKNQNKTIVNTIKRLFTKEVPERQETFEEAVTRLGLSQEEVNKTAKFNRLYALIFLLLAILLFCYAFYLLFAYVSITGWLLSLAATALALTYAFRFDYWSYQMRMRKLGVTFDEWLRSIVGGKGPSV